MYGIHTMNHILLWILFTCSLFQILRLTSFFLVAFCFYWSETRTHTHASVKSHWDTECHNPNNPVQVDCWEMKGLRCRFPSTLLSSLPAFPPFCFSWAPSVSCILCQWNEVFSATGLPSCSPSSAERPRSPRHRAPGPSHSLTSSSEGFAAT